jgi:hypothetical protein
MIRGRLVRRASIAGLVGLALGFTPGVAWT